MTLSIEQNNDNIAAADENATMASSPITSRDHHADHNHEDASHASSSHHNAPSSHSDTNNINNNADSDSEGEYETSYSKLAAVAGKQPSSKKPSRSRRRGGYGNSASVLEVLPSHPRSHQEEEEEEETVEKMKGGMEDDNDVPSKIGDFAMDMDDDFAMEERSTKPNIFMETQDTNDTESESDDDDDDATRPYVESDIEMNDADGAATKTGGIQSDVSDDESEEERPRGRTKQTSKPQEPKVNEAEDEGESEEDEGGFLQSEASGYGFSLGESQALKKADSKVMDEGEPLAEKNMDIDNEGASQEDASQKNVSQEEEPVLPESPTEEAPSSEPVSEPSEQTVTEPAKSSTETIAEPSPNTTCEPQESTLQPAAEPSNSQILSLVDTLFQAVEDKDTMTVGGIYNSVTSHYGWDKISKKKKKMIKGRLIDLMTGKVNPTSEGDVDDAGEDEGEEEAGGEEGETKKSRKKKEGKKKSKKSKKKVEAELLSDNEEEEEPFEGDYESDVAEENSNDSSSDYDEARPTKKGKSKKKSTKSRKLALQQKEYDEHTDSDEDSIGEDAPKSKKKRSSRSKSSNKKGKMAQHLRDRHTKARLRQFEEARIRKEELGHLADGDDEKNPTKKLADNEDEGVGDNDENEESAGPQLSKQDRQRALLIAARFDTNCEEVRMKRMENRVGLIERLRMKRLESLTLSEMAAVEVEVKQESKKEGVEVKKEVKSEGPRLTTSSASGMVEDEVPKIEKPADSSAMLDLDDDSSDEEDSDDDLEIIAPSSSKDSAPSVKNDTVKTPSNTMTLSKPNSKLKKISTVDLLCGPGNVVQLPVKKVKRSVAPTRMAMRNALKAKRVQAGNLWLARELGYKTEADHMADCKEDENKKRKLALKMVEAERAAAYREAAFRGEKAVEDKKLQQIVQAEGSTSENEKEYDEEEDEMAMARAMEQLEPTSADGDENLEERAEGSVEQDKEPQPEGENLEEQSINADMDPSTDPSSNDTQPEHETAMSQTSKGIVVTPSRGGHTEVMSNSENPEEGAPEMMADHASADPFANEDDVVEEADSTNKDLGQDVLNDSLKSSKTGTDDSNNREPSIQDHVSDTHTSEEATSPSKEAAEPSPQKSKKPKNSAWQAMLQKEKESLAKQKKLHRKGGAFVDGEAEEEEEEEGIVGLEDFGFAVQTNKDDDVDADIDQDDLDHVVDDVSDGEGDEEAGTNARKSLQHAEEKEQHKEILRRMREGFDGRRGGIASGVGGARGMHRFDELVAAENREGAKRLGLLNDDELNSEDEEEGGGKKNAKGDDEEEDEHAFLDRMMKERVLSKGRGDQDDGDIEEKFTDDEESEDEAEGAEQTNGDDDEDREQDRLAKHFAKKARRNRILEEFVGDSQFSRSRLIDEDLSMQQDLKTMKTSLCRKRSSMSLLLGSKPGSNLDSKENNCSSKKPKGPSQGSDDGAPKPTSSFLSHEGSLSVALVASRHTASRKRKTTFLSGGRQKISSFSQSQSSSSSSSKTVSLNHVVFTSGDSQGGASSQLPDSSSNSFLGSVKSRRGHSKTTTGKKVSRGGSSLWSKVCSKNFR